MSNPLKILCLILMSLYGCLVNEVLSQTLAPKALSFFQMQLADNSTTTAVFLPTQDNQLWLVYSDPTGRLALFLLTKNIPNPTPDPIPPVPPTPPVPPVPPVPFPQKLWIAVVENPLKTLPEQKHVLSDLSWRTAATDKHNFIGIIPIDLIDKETGKAPADLAPFLDRASRHNLPWVMFTTETGVIVWEGNLPTTAIELKSLIIKYGGI